MKYKTCVVYDGFFGGFIILLYYQTVTTISPVFIISNQALSERLERFSNNYISPFAVSLTSNNFASEQVFIIWQTFVYRPIWLKTCENYCKIELHSFG